MKHDLKDLPIGLLGTLDEAPPVAAATPRPSPDFAALLIPRAGTIPMILHIPTIWIDGFAVAPKSEIKEKQ